MAHGKKFSAASTSRSDQALLRRRGARMREGASFAKFDETVDVAVNLGVDPRHADQIVRGTVVLPHGTGKSVRVLVLAQGDKAKEAEAAGRISSGRSTSTRSRRGGSTATCRGHAGYDGQEWASWAGSRAARLMPNPEVGHRHDGRGDGGQGDQGGKIEFRSTRPGTLHAPVGKVSFSAEQLDENLAAFMDRWCGPSPRRPRDLHQVVTVSSHDGTRRVRGYGGVPMNRPRRQTVVTLADRSCGVAQPLLDGFHRHLGEAMTDLRRRFRSAGVSSSCKNTLALRALRGVGRPVSTTCWPARPGSCCRRTR